VNDNIAKPVSDDQEQPSGLFDARVNLEKLPVDGVRMNVFASDDQMQKLAEILKVSSFESFSANLHVFRKKSGIGVEGNMRAQLIQPCVVSLVPVRQIIDLRLETTFIPKEKIPREEASEIYVDLLGSEIVDEYEGSELDLEPFLIESLGLEIELYPRAKGAVMSEELSGDDPAGLSPFSVLKGLRKN